MSPSRKKKTTRLASKQIGAYMEEMYLVPLPIWEPNYHLTSLSIRAILAFLSAKRWVPGISNGRATDVGALFEAETKFVRVNEIFFDIAGLLSVIWTKLNGLVSLDLGAHNFNLISNYSLPLTYKYHWFYHFSTSNFYNCFRLSICSTTKPFSAD